MKGNWSKYREREAGMNSSLQIFLEFIHPRISRSETGKYGNLETILKFSGLDILTTLTPRWIQDLSIVVSGGAVITTPPTNQTKLEGEKVEFQCVARALPGNLTVRWFREGAPVKEVAALETRFTIQMDGSLVVNPVSADDSGQYLCEVTNGIGEPQSASAYLNVECKIYIPI